MESWFHHCIGVAGGAPCPGGATGGVDAVHSSRREEMKIAQGETLGKRFPLEFPPRRGGVKRSRSYAFCLPRSRMPPCRLSDRSKRNAKTRPATPSAANITWVAV